ncbi:MAG: hypothetical protein J6X70_00820 [Muribaculaceae bacterium]|nr:hypothetical protein [Muribaculaceae bacterium]
MKPLITYRFALITMLAALLIALMGASCHAHKEATATTKEQYDIEAAGSSHTATTSRLRWLSRLALDIDSFEIVMPTKHFADNGKMVRDTAKSLPGQFAMAASRPPSANVVVLRGKRARLNSESTVQQDAQRLDEQADTMSAHRSIDKADHYARDNVGIYKPPDITWWPWLLMAGALIFFIIFWHKSHN